MATATVQILNDEPASVDRLDRLKLAGALAATVEQCETPLVVGLYGTWGTGKTSLMRIMEEELDSSGQIIPIWFDAWQHQFDENPVVALLQKMVDELGLGEEGRKLLHVIAGAFGSLLLKTTTSLNAADIRELSDRYDQERFLIREKQIRLRAHFAELLDRATDHGRVRLVFLIDDLDRCVPEQVLRVLEALKLFLNLPGCVYVLGVDRTALENSIRHRYSGIEVSEAEYLDKIVQLPFSIPPIAAGAMKDFVKELLPTPLHAVTMDLVEGLEENPRQVKRFINSFLLNHELASRTLTQSDYRPTHLAAVLLLQYRKPDIFKQALSDRTVLTSLAQGQSDDDRATEPWLQRLADRLGSIPDDDLTKYLYLSEVAAVRDLRFGVVLLAAVEQKIAVIKVIRRYTKLDLAACKALVDAAPPTVLYEASTHEEAERMVADLVAAGAEAETH